MVKDTVSDPTRVAQLLASELTGLETAPLDRVGVADADDSAKPAPDGTLAYRIAVDGTPVARVELFPGTVTIVFESLSMPAVNDDRLTADRTGKETTLSLSSGVAVKRAVDVVRDTLDATVANGED
jgi:hypothetical protein